MKRMNDGTMSLAEGNNNIDIDGHYGMPNNHSNVIFNSRTPDRSRSAQLAGSNSVVHERKYSLQNTGASSGSDMNANKSFGSGLILEEESFAADL